MASQKRKGATGPSEAADSIPKKPRQQKQPAQNRTLLGPHEQIITELTPKYDVLPASVISSTQIRKRVISTTKHLLEATEGTVPVALLYARPADACKLITIVEQSKRVLEGEGKPCFQYNQLFELPPETKKPDIVEKTVLEGDADKSGDDDDDNDDFEVMESQFEKAVLPQETRRAPKSLRVFLSLAAIPELKAKSDITAQATETTGS